MTKNLQILSFILLISGVFIISSCSKSDDQRKFEQRALVEPENITEMSVDGKRNGNEDPDDWTIGPMFSGLIEIETPAYPNPVSYNSSLRIDVLISSIETINSIEVYAFEFPTDLDGPFYVEHDLSSTGLITINLNAESIANSSGGSQASGIYRVLIYDGRENLISYGDVRVE